MRQSYRDQTQTTRGMMDRRKPSAIVAMALRGAVLAVAATPALAQAQQTTGAGEPETRAVSQGPAAVTPPDGTRPAEQSAAEPAQPATLAPVEGTATPLPPVAPAATVTVQPTKPVALQDAASRPAEPAASDSWFARPPLTATVGLGAKKLSVTLYGFFEVDAIHDSTRSYGDAIGPSLVARTDTFDSKTGRTQFSMRNTRLGLAFQSAIAAGLKTSAVFEGDFFGNQPAEPPTSTETAYFDSPTFRLRHAYVKLENNYVDVLAGQTYDLFGWQNYFFPMSAEFLGLPNMLFSRHAQVRLSHTFGADGPIGVDVAAAMLRPAQRDSEIPDTNAGLRFSVNGWKGITTPGNVGTTALPLSIGVSSVFRQFKANAYTPPPVQSSNSLTGWGLSVDALLPVIPAADSDDRGNRLTLTGSFVTGTGIADLITANGGAVFPTLPNPAQSPSPPVYTANIDNGLVTFDINGVMHTIDWRAFKAGLQYYLPPSGRVALALNYTQAESKNMAALFPVGAFENGLIVKIAKTSRYADANLFWDVTPAVRVGASVQYSQVEYLDGNKPHNLREMAQALYIF